MHVFTCYLACQLMKKLLIDLYASLTFKPSIESYAHGSVRPALFYDEENPTALTWPVRARQITIEEAKAGTEGIVTLWIILLSWGTHNIFDKDAHMLFCGFEILPSCHCTQCTYAGT